MLKRIDEAELDINFFRACEDRTDKVFFNTKVLNKNEAEHDGSDMEEGLPLEEQPNKMPDVFKGLSEVELNTTVLSTCKERTGKMSKVLDAARDIEAKSPEVPKKLNKAEHVAIDELVIINENAKEEKPLLDKLPNEPVEVPKQLDEAELGDVFFFNTKVLNKLKAKVLTKLKIKVLTKIEAEHDGSAMEEGLPLDEQSNKMPDVLKQLGEEELDTTVYSTCEERTGELSKVLDAARDFEAELPEVPKQLNEVGLNDFFFNAKVLTKLEAKVLT